MASKLTSGSVIDGSDQVVSLANNLLESTKCNRCCAISIANATCCRLTNPRRYIHHGTLVSEPADIETQSTGLILAHKLSGSVVGSAGVVTYDIAKTFGDQKLQIMWRVPNSFGNKMNVNIGQQVASQELFQEMLSGTCGNVVSAADITSNYEFPLVQFGFNVRVVMHESGRTPLAVYFGKYDMSYLYSMRVY